MIHVKSKTLDKVFEAMQVAQSFVEDKEQLLDILHHALVLPFLRRL